MMQRLMFGVWSSFRYIHPCVPGLFLFSLLFVTSPCISTRLWPTKSCLIFRSIWCLASKLGTHWQNPFMLHKPNKHHQTSIRSSLHIYNSYYQLKNSVIVPYQSQKGEFLKPASDDLLIHLSYVPSFLGGQYTDILHYVYTRTWW